MPPPPPPPHFSMISSSTPSNPRYPKITKYDDKTDPETDERRGYAATALESFELQAVQSFAQDEVSTFKEKK